MLIYSLDIEEHDDRDRERLVMEAGLAERNHSRKIQSRM